LPGDAFRRWRGRGRREEGAGGALGFARPAAHGSRQDEAFSRPRPSLRFAYLLAVMPAALRVLTSASFASFSNFYSCTDSRDLTEIQEVEDRYDKWAILVSESIILRFFL
jgi:hypothetical protein